MAVYWSAPALAETTCGAGMTLFYMLQLIGVAVFAASGALAGGRRNMDVLGVVVLGVVTSIGGGTIRDVLLDRHPVFWIEDPMFLAASVVAVFLTLLYLRFLRPPRRSLEIADALGLGLFTILGAQVAQREAMGSGIVVLMATITGVAGGMIRDVLSAEVPMILRPGRLYATAAIAGTVVYLLLEYGGVARPGAAVAGIVATVLLRLSAIFWGLELPVPPVRD